MSEWTKIEDDKPECGKPVLVRVISREGDPEYYEDQVYEIRRNHPDPLLQSYLDWRKSIDLEVTHWTELPKGCPTCGRL
jgi:hypothetical protein